jgi:hypothetical protein
MAVYRSGGKSYPTMSIQNAIKELNRIKKQCADKIDALAAELEKQQNTLADLNHAIITVTRLSEDPSMVLVHDETGPSEQDKIVEVEPDPAPVQKPTPDPSVDPIDADPVLEEESIDEDQEDFQDKVFPGGRQSKKRKKYIGIAFNKKQAPPPPSLGPSKVLDGKFHCDRCRADFISQSSLDDHNELRHNRNPDGHRCPIASCRKKFETEQDLEDHLIKKHPKWYLES